MSKAQTGARQTQEQPTVQSNPPPAPKPLDISVRIHAVRASGNILANASVDLNGVFAIRGVRIMQGQNGPFVSMPSYKVGDEYRDVCFPCTKEFREQFQSTVLGAYQQQLGQLSQRGLDQTQYGQEQSGPVMQMQGG